MLVICFSAHVRLVLKAGLDPVPYKRKAPSGPLAFGRVNIQFCQADNRAKILVAIVSGPANLWFASMAVKASGEKLERSSIAMRSSSSQSKSSGV
jgi:hypothetical protein